MTTIIAILLAQCGTEEVCGFRYFNAGMCSMSDAYFNAPVRAYPGKTLQLYGARTDVDGPAVVVANDVRRDAGAILDVRRGPNVSDRVLVVDAETGSLIMACEEGSNTRTCTLVDGSGISGHWSLTVMPRYYVTIAGRLSENHINTLVDGGCDTMEPDGGCYSSFAAGHGELTVVSSEARPRGGWGIQYVNPVTDGSGTTRFFVDAWGGIGQRHMMIRSQFPKCPANIEATMPQTQQYIHGAIESTQMYAFDEHRWYFCNGTEWTVQ